MNPLNTLCPQIDEEVKKSLIDPSGKSKPITDGIVDIELYTKACPKILWILKEPYDTEEDGVPAGGGWSLTQDVIGRWDFHLRIKRTQSTWHPIIYICYGLLNGFLPFEAMDKITDNPEMVKILRNIAVINVKKLPGLTRTHDFGAISEAYSKHKGILLRQLSVYNPDVIIGASTLPLFYDDLGIDRKGIQTLGCVNSIVKNKKIYIDAYHPAQLKVQRNQYVNDIITVVKSVLFSK